MQRLLPSRSFKTVAVFYQLLFLSYGEFSNIIGIERF